MSKPFVLRAVHGDVRGKYFAEFDSKNMRCGWTDRPEDAELMDGEDAASNVMALIDTVRIAAVPEVYGTATDAQRMEFASTAARGMFQSPDAITSVILALIRESADDPIYDNGEGPQGDGRMMSVWEWVLRCMEAKSPPEVEAA